MNKGNCLIQNISVVTPDGLIASATVVVKNGRIAEIIKEHDDKIKTIQSDLPVLELGGCFLLPGFIDIHIHGSSGHDVMEGTVEALDQIRCSLPKTGVTAFLATTMTMSSEKIHFALENVRRQMQEESGEATCRKSDEKLGGARILGVHLEGPFLNPQAKGAQPEAYMRAADFSLIEGYLDVVKLVTLAPETDVMQRFIKEAVSKGVVVSIGHTKADYETTLEAIAAGAKSATHLFNAMTPLHHRNPGVVGAALIHDIYAEMIADDVHIHPALYEMVIKAKGVEKVVLITDAIMGQCMACGRYTLAGQEVEVTKQDARLPDGTLAGSVLTMEQAFAHVMDRTGRSLVEMARMTATNAAELLGLHDIGRIAVGARADFAVLDCDKKLIATVIGGELVYKR